jgi:hypothetical protein
LNRLSKISFRCLIYLLWILIIAVVLIGKIIMIITQFNKIQFKICLNKLRVFLKISTSLNTKLAAKTHLAVGEFSLVKKKNKKFFLKWNEGALISVAFKRDGQHFGPEKTEEKYNASKKVLFHIKWEALNDNSDNNDNKIHLQINKLYDIATCFVICCRSLYDT